MNHCNNNARRNRLTDHARERIVERDIDLDDIALIRRFGTQLLQPNGNTRYQVTEACASRYGRNEPFLYALIGATVVVAPDGSIVTTYWHDFAGRGGPNGGPWRRAA